MREWGQVLPWIVPLLGIAGLLAFRSWKQDVAIRSGELMDVRDLSPTGEVDVEVRVLAERLFRIELQIEGWVFPVARDRALPCRLVVTKADSVAEGEVICDLHLTLGDLLPFAAGSETDAAGRLSFWGNLPLLEFSTESLLRLRFEVSILLDEDAGESQTGQVVKAAVVVKEGVRPLQARGGKLERILITDARPF